MDFTCVIESTSAATSKLARMTLDILKAGYIIQSQMRNQSDNGVVSYQLSATSTGGENMTALEHDLSQLDGYQLIKINNKVVNTVSAGQATATSATGQLDSNIDVTKILSVIKDKYPNFSTELKIFSKSLPDQVRKSTLIDIGKRVGAGIYNRDYSLGSPLPMPLTLKRELMPALKQFSAIELASTDISLTACPFCAKSKSETASCQFISGFIQGFLDKNTAVNEVSVSESFCGSGVDGVCTFSIKS